MDVQTFLQQKNQARTQAPSSAPLPASNSAPSSVEQFLQNKNKKNAAPTPTDTPLPTATPTPAPSGDHPLESLFAGIISETSKIINEFRNNPGETTKQSALDTLKGIGRGAALTFENFLKMTNPVQSPAVKQEISATENVAQSPKLQPKTTLGKDVLSPIAQFAVPSVAFPGGEGAGFVQKAAEFVVQSQMLYDPQSTKAGSELVGRIKSSADNFLAYVGFEGVAKPVAKVALKPMTMAIDAISDNINQYLSKDIYDKIAPLIAPAIDKASNTVSISSQDLADVLSGKKPAIGFDFFQSPEWKDVIKKYGGDLSKYPDVIRAEKPAIDPVIVSQNRAQLPTADLHAALEDTAEQAVKDVYSGDDKGFSMSSSLLGDTVKELENRGYNVDSGKLVSGITDVANYRRAVDDYDMGVLKQTTGKALLDQLDQNGAFKPLLQVRRLYNLLQNKAGYSDQMVADAYDRWAKKNNLGSIDELGGMLKKMGIKLPDNPISEVVDFANSLPTKSDLTVKLKMPSPVSLSAVIDDAVKPGTKAVETPFMVSPTELEKLVEPKPVDIVKDSQDTRVDEIINKIATGSELPGGRGIQGMKLNESEMKTLIGYMKELQTPENQKWAGKIVKTWTGDKDLVIGVVKEADGQNSFLVTSYGNKNPEYKGVLRLHRTPIPEKDIQDTRTVAQKLIDEKKSTVRTPVQSQLPIESPKPPEGSKLPEEIQATVKKATDAVDELHSKVSPMTMSDRSRLAAGFLRKHLSFVANDKVVEHIQNAKVESAFEKLSEDERIGLINNYETTGSFGPGMEAYSEAYKKSTDAAHQILQNVFGLNGYVDNYIKRGFKFTSPDDEAKFVDGFTKSLEKYSTSPLKTRQFTTLKDAMDYMTENGINFQLVESNPETLRQWTVTNARAAQSFSFLKTKLKDFSLIHFIAPGDTLKPNETFLEDRWAQVMFHGDQGLVQAGKYAAPREVATLLNNAVSKGLFDISPTASFLKEVNNTLNQFQLGLSAFHVATTTVNSMASEFGLAIQEAFGPHQQLSALTHALKGVSVIGGVVSDYMTGNDFIHKLERGDTDALDKLDSLVNVAGARINIENIYRTQAIERFNKAIEENKPISAALNAPFALIQKVAEPIMERLVPRVKFGRFLTDADSALARATKNGTVEISDEAKAKLLGSLWDKTDNLHGQLVQDNLFWNNMVKDSANLFFRSFGWTYGTLRLAGNAVKETLQTPARLKAGEEAITASMATVMAYPVATAMIGGIMHYMNTGKAPESYMDYFFPASGEMTPDGRPIRLSVPGYMKDFFSYTRSPLQTLLNKMSPELQTAKEIMSTKDYYNVMIVNPDDPIGKQSEDAGKYLLSKFEPFSLRSFGQIQSESSTASPKDLLEGFMGFQRAGGANMNTALENKIQSVYANQIGVKTMSQEQWQDTLKKSAAKKAAMSGDYSLLQQLVHDGVYTAKGASQVRTSINKQRAKGYDVFEEMFSKLSTDAQVRLYNSMSADDQSTYYPILRPQARRLISQ